MMEEYRESHSELSLTSGLQSEQYGNQCTYIARTSPFNVSIHNMVKFSQIKTVISSNEEGFAMLNIKATFFWCECTYKVNIWGNNIQYTSVLWIEMFWKKQKVQIITDHESIIFS